jgi:hypothetical protein
MAIDIVFQQFAHGSSKAWASVCSDCLIVRQCEALAGKCKIGCGMQLIFGAKRAVLPVAVKGQYRLKKRRIYSRSDG